MLVTFGKAAVLSAYQPVFSPITSERLLRRR